MNQIGADASSLPAMVDRAARALSSARTAAEVLEARDIAGALYDAAKSAARIAKAKGAHDSLIAQAHRTQADALEIEASAKRRLADEYDAAQERGEISQQGAHVPDGNMKTADIGISRKDIHEARLVRNAEAAEPGVVRKALDEALKDGREPTKAVVRRAVSDVAKSSEPKMPKKRDDPNAARIERQRQNGQIWTRLKDALAGLSSLPLPTDVVSIIHGNGKAKFVDDNLQQATSWLKEFSDAWRNRDADGSGEND